MNREDLKKLEYSGSTGRPQPAAEEAVQAIFTVKEANYIPPKVKLRARIDPTMFTGSFLGKDFAGLEADPKVRTVALSQAMPSPKPQ